MDSYQDRVVEESHELHIKICKLVRLLSRFLITDYEEKLLREQLIAMLAYQSVLVKRIARFVECTNQEDN